ncbi:U1 small nuclear ribonucleoprotein of 70kDa N-terminal [Arabidopsis suecica]|uniref:U1 small nuclear ribonucleoprotein of 70kDa N-terminal n=1 Tax=Arabidopsis suecica TaxID=45249 RepID=A0A8T1ZW99_ARASU|nr:U1 small nuclear ribonucleoprotein of 70kDa N-terminal [Arabidopsis suecica]
MVQSHPTGLSKNNLLKLFEPRPPLEYKPPSEKRKCPHCISDCFLTLFSRALNLLSLGMHLRLFRTCQL